MSQEIRVLLADDHPALRIGLRVLLEQAAGIVVVGEAGDGQEVLTQIEALQPDVAVLDCLLPEMSGPAVALAIRQRGLPTRILALSAHSDEKYVRAMMDAGAVGYILKEEAPGAIVAAVRATAKGEGWFSPSVAAHVSRWTRRERPTEPELTEREWAVLRLVAQGKSNKEIALALSVAQRTVEFHVGNILKKLDAVSRVEAAVWIREHEMGA